MFLGASSRALPGQDNLHGSEIEPLLRTPALPNYDTEGHVSASTSSKGPMDSIPQRQIGVVSAVFIIFNRIVGTGIFATPSTVLRFSGSIGLSLLLWIAGSAFAITGMQVYIIWGSALPHNGGEKNYLEYLFPRPKQLITSIYAANTVLIAYGAGNSIVFAEYTLASFLSSSAPSPDTFSPVRLVAFLCVTGVFALHGLHIRAGIQLQNLLGFMKIGILLAVVGSGFIALSGNLQQGVPRPGNFDSWERIWDGSRMGGSIISTSLYNVIYCFNGFSNANYALSEIHNPARTLQIAGPVAIVTVTVFYLFCNLAYYAAASKEEIVNSGRLVAALLFRNVWGPRTEGILNVFVAISALGNILSGSFSQGRLNQALGKEGVLPFSSFWASSWPANAPLAGLGLNWMICTIVIFGVPTGDAFNFILHMNGYPHAVVNTVISFGLIYLAFRKFRTRRQRVLEDQPTLAAASSAPLFPPSLLLVIPALIFGSANVFLFVVPLIRPPPGLEPYKHLPYWAHAVTVWCFFLVGGLWWVWHYRSRTLDPTPGVGK